MIFHIIFRDTFIQKIFLYTIFLFALTTTNTHMLFTTNLSFSQTPDQNITQNVTKLKIVEPNTTFNTEEGGQVVNNELIVLLKQPSQISPDEAGFILEDPVSSITREVEDQGLKVNQSQLLSGINALVLTIDSHDIFMEESTANVTDSLTPSNITAHNNQALENLVNRIEKNPLIEDVETNKLMVTHQSSSLVEDVETNTLMTTSETSSQVIPIGLDRIDGEPNKNETSFVDVDVAIMDTGIDADHHDLNVLEDKQINFIGSTPDDLCSHGTHDAGIVGAKDNDIGIVGVAPGAKLWNVKVLDKNPSTGGCLGSLAGVIQGLNYVAENADEIDVLYLGLGGFCSANSCDSPVYEKAINRVVDNGVVVVVSAGSSNQNAKDFIPARFLSPITVSTISDTDGKCGGLGPNSNLQRGGPDDTLAGFSNFGSSIDIAAPGVNILSSYPDDTYAILSGSTKSAAYVAGAAALIKAEHPNISPSIVQNMLLENSSNMQTECDNKGGGYFKDDRDGFPEPLLYVKNINGN